MLRSEDKWLTETIVTQWIGVSFHFLEQGDYEEARALCAGVESSNDVESNYLTFYTLYSNYLYARNDSKTLAAEDSSSLAKFCSLCLD